ncbi:MAG: PepSY domain-containing protein [Alphaproteobacteria bacterium]|nr:PepSY domain-containing protein [Alphaproteobacteria bacterium]MBU6472666.1 PepSY domain-containing protein [Alphaproteobacteria bacterium]MDE2011376.1 PepSY domain-containing protein [Alphaproteobacteria bacterium]MDE2072896.1 PepSY domain-containing protein [Alphaproteobacteria bacterium]MDE2352431.1 PepSY domain-containing protein [Alphaproteobacteria bacterium]
MRKPILLTMAALMLAGSAGSALASPKCTTEPESKWLGEDAMKAKIAGMGYTKIRTFQKTKGGCYEIYGFTADGQKAEVYFNPVSGAVVEKNIGGEEDED